jgi:hypothetical protein
MVVVLVWPLPMEPSRMEEVQREEVSETHYCLVARFLGGVGSRGGVLVRKDPTTPTGGRSSCKNSVGN